MVVPVLMTSCQVSEYLKRCPSNPQTTTMRVATMKAQGEPTTTELLWENFRKISRRVLTMEASWGDASDLEEFSRA